MLNCAFFVQIVQVLSALASKLSPHQQLFSTWQNLQHDGSSRIEGLPKAVWEKEFIYFFTNLSSRYSSIHLQIRSKAEKNPLV